jgi:5-hydroxyisourate hydrolase
MSKLSTHVLDTVGGGPAVGVHLQLWRIGLEGRELVKETTTNEDGRTDEPLLAGENFLAGEYEIVFRVADYFRANGTAQAEQPFLNEVPIRFFADPSRGNYHVPLLCSPWAYTTYRGS